MFRSLQCSNICNTVLLISFVLGFGWSHSLVIFVMTGLSQRASYQNKEKHRRTLKWSFRRSFIPFPERREEHKMRVSPPCPVTSSNQSPDQTSIGMVTGQWSLHLHHSPASPHYIKFQSIQSTQETHSKQELSTNIIFVRIPSSLLNISTLC